jgi:undecaprenyl diphosphate synthase
MDTYWCRRGILADPDPPATQRRRTRAMSPAPCLCKVTIVLVLLLALQSKSACAFLSQERSRAKPRIFKSQLHGATNGDSGLNPQKESSHSVDNDSSIPQHIAFVCDGNSRWARARNLPAAVGHAAGADRIVNILDTLIDARVQYCTLYLFSTENWKRPPTETRGILFVVEQSARRFYDRALKENVRIRVLGDLTDERIPKSLVEILHRLERDTSENVSDSGHSLTLSLAINYGGRRDIVNASKQLAACIVDGSLDVDSITEDTFASFLGTSGIPDPDLIIRTSGESRLSNFLLWNAAYTELYFTDTLWPDFDETCVADALRWYAQRRRSFGSRKALGSEPSVR